MFRHAILRHLWLLAAWWLGGSYLQASEPAQAKPLPKADPPRASLQALLVYPKELHLDGLKAAANAAPIDNVPIAVLVHVSINFVVKISYASAPLDVTVTR